MAERFTNKSDEELRELILRNVKDTLKGNFIISNIVSEEVAGQLVDQMVTSYQEEHQKGIEMSIEKVHKWVDEQEKVILKKKSKEQTLRRATGDAAEGVVEEIQNKYPNFNDRTLYQNLMKKELPLPSGERVTVEQALNSLGPGYKRDSGILVPSLNIAKNIGQDALHILESDVLRNLANAYKKKAGVNV